MLIGIRDLETGLEINPADPVLRYREDFEVVRDFDLHSAEDLAKSFDTMDGLLQEGYVVVDKQFRRVKVKHPRYVLYHHLVGSLTKKKVLDAVRKNESPEILTYFPTWKAEFDDMSAKLDDLVSQYTEAYTPIRDIPVQKDFALAVKDGPLKPAPFFAVRAGKAKNFREHFSQIRLEMLAEIIGLKGGDEVQAE